MEIDKILKIGIRFIFIFLINNNDLISFAAYNGNITLPSTPHVHEEAIIYQLERK